MAAPKGSIDLTPQFSSTNKGTTAQRPAQPKIGQFYFDTTLVAAGKPVWCNTEFDPAGPTPAVWVDGLGVVV